MLYFSEQDRIPVYLDDQKFLGSLDDLIFSIIGNPYIRQIVVSTPLNNSLPAFFQFNNKKKAIIPIEYVRKLGNKRIIIDKNYQESQIGENELYVKKNLLDTQVIDIEENNIVRVNDVLIQTVNSSGFVIYGVDIGLSGILRQFKVEKILESMFRLFGKYYVPQSVLAWSDIQPLELTRGRVVVKSRFDSLKKLHPADLADYLETQNFKNVITLIGGIDKEYLAQVISELNQNFQIELFKVMPLDKIIQIIIIMDPNDAVDIISQFPQKKQDIILDKLPEKEASVIRRLLRFSGTPLGEFLNPDYLTVYPEEMAFDVVKKIKKNSGDFSLLENVYVVNKESHLIGVFSLHELLLQDSNTPVYRFMMQKVITANTNTPVEAAFRRMGKYEIASLPVVDDERRIIGVVLIENLSREIAQEL